MSYDKVLFKHDDPHGIGDVYFIWQKGGSGSLLATTGSDGSVAIFNRHGQLIERILLQGLCSGFSWDSDGDLLGIITAHSSQVTLWDANSQRKQLIDTGLRDPLSCIIWSKQNQIMAVGTARGNLSIYNHQTSKRIPVLGKHSKRIVCGAWSTDNVLALGSDDKSFSLSNMDGVSLRAFSVRDIPSDMYFAQMRTDERTPGENAISMILGKRTLYLFYLPDPESPTELGFQSRYGSLVQHKWFGDGFILLGFSHGHLVAISTHPKEVGQELWQIKNHREMLTGVAYCPSLSLVASCGDNNIKIHSITSLQETEKILSMPDQSAIQMVDWSNDGQLLACTTAQGAICTFVTKLQTLYAVSPPRLAILSSIAEITIYHYTPDKDKTPPNTLSLEIEPSFLAIGPSHLAAGMNNHVWFYDLGKKKTDTPLLLGDREFISEIRDVKLNADFCAALCGGQLILQSIESENPATKNKTTQSFPDAIPGLNGAVITCIALTNKFLVFATDLGNLVFFCLDQWEVSLKYRHTMGIKNIYSDFEGTKLVIVDDHDQGFVFLPVTEEAILISDFLKKCQGVLWDYSCSNIFIAFDNKTCVTYSFTRYSIRGKHTVRVGDTKIMTGQIPIMLYDGEVCLCCSGGNYATIVLSTHIKSVAISPKDQFNSLLKMRKYNEAYNLCETIDEQDTWEELGRTAVENLEPVFGIKVYNKMNFPSMVYALEDIQDIDDINLLAGFCCVCLDRPEEAKVFFAKSICPEEGLELCRDLLQWEEALILAKTLAPEQVPFISREYAQQLEFRGNYTEALNHYEKGYSEDIEHGSGESLFSSTSNLEEHIRLCKFGLARTCIRTGDYRRGIQFALELNDKELYYECAEILVEIGHLLEAAELLEKGEHWDDSCKHYAELKMWNKVEQLLPHVQSIKIHAAYAKAKEEAGQFDEAIISYKNAQDLDSVIRIYLNYLSDPHSASEVLMESRSNEGARMLSRFYQQMGDYDSALECLIVCECIQEAFSIAQKHSKLRLYGELLEKYDKGQPKDFLALAEYFEGEKYTLLAGKYYYLAQEFPKGLKFLLKASTFSNEENTALILAIDCVAQSKSEQLCSQLIEFLLGEVDGTPKDPKFLFRLYMARRQFKDAAKTAVIIANQEQISGSYRNAHDLLFSMYQELRRNNLSISSLMRQNLILLHRYTIVRIHVKLGNHLLAAKLLVQIAANISQFPSHIVPILTSTVIECNRAGLKKSAFTYASMIMRPEYRNQVDAKYSKKVESIVRKAPKGIKDFKDDIDDETMECPICDAKLPVMDVTCYQCKTTLPICIATGQHIVKQNMAACPECDFPCFRPEMEKILAETNQCPMCSKTVDSNRLMDIEDIRPYILPSQ